ncbi:MAG: cytochrome P460 family protein [Hyphomicrobiaceae bacterium]
MRYFVWLLAVCSMCLAAGTGLAQMLETKPGQAGAKGLLAFGTPRDIRYAKTLWKRLRRARLVGVHRYSARPTKGDQPHGSIQQIIAGKISVKGRRARVVVKANHRGKDVSLNGVFEDPKRFLTGYAVMAKRERGYNQAHADWFWAVYNPDGSLRKFNGKAIAGRVDTGADNGCIGCHKKYGGKDYEMLTRQ